MKIKNIVILVGLVFLLITSAVSSQTWPTRPIDAIVGWSAGGTSDITVRAVAREMADFLGVEVRVSNMEGANGGIAYQNVYLSAPDGYRWFGGAEVQATYPITKQAEVGWEEFYPFPAGMGATTIYVKSESGYDTILDLVKAIKESPKTVKYGTTSRGGNGHIFGEVFAGAAGITDLVQDIPYDGGREAGNYLIAGEVEYISVSLGDVSDWAEAGTFKPILNLYPEDYEWRGVVFPSVNHFYPELEVYTSINPYWGFAVRRDTPEAILIKIAEAFKYAVEQERFKEALDSRAIIVAPLMGEAADIAIAMVGSGRGWAHYDYGIVDTSPAEFDIPRLANWKWPYNESSANVIPWPEKVEEIFTELKNR